MAAEAAFGATTAWVADIDKGSCKILAHRYPDVPNLGDITAIDWSTVEPVDIITGGSPCQDLSHAGRRAGMTEGTRSNLWVAMREAIAQLRPTFVIWENVRGAYSAAADSAVVVGGRLLARDGDGGVSLRALGRVLGDLSDLGYDCQWRGLRAADVGAPHGRFRVFVVARLADADGAGLGSFRRIERVERDADRRSGEDRVRHEAEQSTLTLLPTPTTQDAANNGGPSQFDRNTRPLNTEVLLLPTPAVNDMGKAYTPEEWDAWTDRMKAAHGNGNGHGKSLEIEAARQDFGQYEAAIRRWETATGMSAPAPTEPTGKGGAHRLSPAFTSWMMGLPPGWITDVPGITRNEALKACGNGVVPQQAYAAIVHALDTFQAVKAA